VDRTHVGAIGRDVIALTFPDLYDVIAAHSNGFGSLTYVNYGLTDRVTVGLIPTAGFKQVSNGSSLKGDCR
jgi:hypothetical protein